MDSINLPPVDRHFKDHWLEKNLSLVGTMMTQGKKKVFKYKDGWSDDRVAEVSGIAFQRVMRSRKHFFGPLYKSHPGEGTGRSPGRPSRAIEVLTDTIADLAKVVGRINNRMNRLENHIYQGALQQDEQHPPAVEVVDRNGQTVHKIGFPV